MEEVTYTAIVTRTDPGWSIYVPEVDRHTYAAHLREIEEMACDLVQVMTGIPLEDITVNVVLPEDLAAFIAAMRRARDQAVAAEEAAREAQQAAAAALRETGAALRDIAATLGLSYQRVHQILEEFGTKLDLFRRQVDLSLESGALGFELPVTSDDGSTPVVVALATEPLGALTKRITAIGGYANVFVKDGACTRFVAVFNTECAICEPGTTMVGDEAPSPYSTVGMFLDYVMHHPRGVAIPAVLERHPSWARDARQVELEPTHCR